MAKTKKSRTTAGIVLDPAPLFDLSPNLYSQFMEPLGSTDGSVEACWDHQNDDWRKDFVDITKKIRPGLLRWGGCLSSYYRWKEGVGPRNKRVPMYNILWHGIETNQVGTHEFVDLARRAKSQAFYCVNFESDGRKKWANIPKWGVRSGGPAEAAAWVDYCNNPDSQARKKNGAAEPFNMKLWQIGNETSYDKNGFDRETAIRKTITFAKAMRKVDPDLELIGWGDSGWAPRMIEAAGEHLNYIAYHTGYRSTMEDAPFADDRYRKDLDATWAHLMTGADWANQKLTVMRQQTDGLGIPLALTESHYSSVPGLNRGRFYTTWAIGVSYARILNLYNRNGDALKIAMVCDYAGTRWMCNGVIVPAPYAKPFMLPVTHVQTLYSHHTGNKAVSVEKCPSTLDITASRRGKKVYLHVANTNRTRSVQTSFGVEGMKIKSGKVFAISQPSDFEVFNADTSAKLEPVESALPRSLEWSFPGASVSAVELTLA